MVVSNSALVLCYQVKFFRVLYHCIMYFEVDQHGYETKINFNYSISMNKSTQKIRDNQMNQANSCWGSWGSWGF